MPALRSKIILAVATTVALSSCSTPRPAAVSPGSGPTSVTVGIPGMVLNADVFLAEQNGSFASAGLTVKNQVISAGTNAVPQLLNGSMQFAVVDMPTAIIAAGQGVGIAVVAPSAVGSSGSRGFGGVIARAGSGISKPADLAGKKVAVNQLNGTSQTLVTATLKKRGADSAKVQYVEVAPEQTIAALGSGRVDAAVTGEPLVSMALGMGMTYVFNQEEDTVAGAATFVFAAAKSYIASNPAVVASFAKAIIAANTAANSDTAAVKQIMIREDQVPAELAPAIVPPTFGSAAVSVKDVQTTIDLMVANGQLPAAKAPKPGDVIAGNS